LSHHASVRGAALTGFRALCRSYGLDSAAILREAGLPVRAEDEPDRRIPVAAVNLALERAAELSGAEDFGLRLAELRGFSNLGPVTVLARDEPDMRSALDIFIAYLPLHNEALDIRLSVDAEVAILSCSIAAPGSKTQALDVAVAMLHRILRQLLGDGWGPEMICLERLAPVRARHFQHVFGRRVQFMQDFSGIVFHPADLARPNLLADPKLRPYTAGLRESLKERRLEPLATSVRRLLYAILSNRRCTAPFVAQQLGMSRRTLDRRLAGEGTSFLALLDEVRRDIARGQIEGSRRSMAQIADMTGFSSPAAFSTWFAARFHMSPRRWRTKAQTEAGTNAWASAG
jgi:AraC-like DNA-binding protein